MKYYRCGFCGHPLNEFRDTINSDQLNASKEKNVYMGDLCGKGCCEPEQSNPQRVTRDMAIDAGDPSLGGELI